MPFEYVNLTALLVCAIAVIALEKTKWIQSVAIAELVVALLLLLIVADFLRLPVRNVDTVLAVMILSGWVPVLVAGKAKATLVPAAIAGWIAAVDMLIGFGWIRVDAIGHLL